MRYKIFLRRDSDVSLSEFETSIKENRKSLSIVEVSESDFALIVEAEDFNTDLQDLTLAPFINNISHIRDEEEFEDAAGDEPIEEAAKELAAEKKAAEKEEKEEVSSVEEKDSFEDVSEEDEPSFEEFEPVNEPVVDDFSFPNEPTANTSTNKLGFSNE